MGSLIFRIREVNLAFSLRHKITIEVDTSSLGGNPQNHIIYSKYILKKNVFSQIRRVWDKDRIHPKMK